MGDYPKIHDIVRLLKDLSRIYDDCGLRDLISVNLETLYLIEESYISSRYLPREYGRDIALKILEFADRIYRVFECLEERH
jgi:HEPN domain-containing protein